MTGRMRHVLAALAGLGLGLSALGPALAPGFVLSYDMVFVPDPAFTRLTFGLTGTLPRNVPSDAFVTTLATALPADLVQKLILLAIFVMASTAAASLVPSERLMPRLAAGVCYAWNPFVAERLILGQWAVLLGYAALPWVVCRASRVTTPQGTRWLVIALVPAALGGFAALAISGLTALIVALAGAQAKAAAAIRVLAVLTVLSLPWLVPGWLRPGGIPGDGAAVEAFAARADTPFGTLGSLLTLGGVWNGEVVPKGYGNPVIAALWLLVTLLALVSYATWTRREGLPPWAVGLGVAGLAGFVLAALGATVPWLLRGLIAGWPGFAVLRDGQQWAAPLAVVVAVGLGLAVDRVPTYAGLCAALVPVVLLPGLAWGAAGRLAAVDYPASWTRARQIIDADRTAGAVAVLPWAAYRGYGWNDGHRVLDPLPRFLPRRVIINDAVTVGGRTVPAEDPRARRLDPAISAAGEADLTGAFRRAGVRYVAVDAGPGAPGPGRLAGAERILAEPDLELYRIPAPEKVQDRSAPPALVYLACAITLATIVWSLSVTGITLVPRHPRVRSRVRPRVHRRRKAP